MFLDLSKYQRKEVIHKGDNLKYYKIQEKQTGSIQVKLQNLTDEQLSELLKELQIINYINHLTILNSLVIVQLIL